MAYSTSTMRLMGGVPGQQLFLYRTADQISTVVASGYFDDAYDHYNLSTGDIIMVVYAFGGTQKLISLVATNTAGTITTTKMDLA